MVYGLWFMVHGLWFMVYGLCFMLASRRERGAVRSVEVGLDGGLDGLAVQRVLYLLQGGADLSAATYSDGLARTAPHAAARGGHTGCVRTLLATGPEPPPLGPQ